MSASDATVIIRTVTRVVVPMIFVTSFALFLQGHNLPGGGFIAGVLTATRVRALYIIFGLDYIEDEILGRDVERQCAAVPPSSRTTASSSRSASALAAGSGLVAMACGLPFLNQTLVVLHHLPLYGELELASAFVFDLGVYLVVVGALLTILSVVGAE